MNACLICPHQRESVASLAENAPLGLFTLLGKPLLEYWIEHLVLRGCKEITLFASDRPEKIRETLGEGERWGVKLLVQPTARELSLAEAADKAGAGIECHVADSFPWKPDQKLFSSLGDLFRVVSQNLDHPDMSNRVGVKEIRPGIWVGRQANISSTAVLTAPCWIGDRAKIGNKAVVGPCVILENEVVVEEGAEIRESLIGSQTFVGSAITLNQSIASGAQLMNWNTGSHTKIVDAFLLCSLRPLENSQYLQRLCGRAVAAGLMVVTSPIVGLAAGWMLLMGQRIVRPRRATPPQGYPQAKPIIYFEFPFFQGGLRRWPQMWNIVKGEFVWVGNRPLTPNEARKLENDFEKLWLSVPLGFMSLSEAQGCIEPFCEEAKAHSSFYSVQADWKLDLKIIVACIKRFFLSKKETSGREATLVKKILHFGRTAPN
ncbi:MAG: Mannose-phosphate guanylyltransferase [Verrucomicrobiales bacterium]|nr:Mannose-phosphate guanylyltransferase [Verrucomicrobiales bacterium]